MPRRARLLGQSPAVEVGHAYIGHQKVERVFTSEVLERFRSVRGLGDNRAGAFKLLDHDQPDHGFVLGDEDALAT